MLLKLEKIGKIYDSNDILTVGIRGIDLAFDYNEFVTIEGESGSGKSTLLNVIGANDTYEEGELYFNGEPTSHYSESDWEKYRERNIATIFQDFNIIENLTVPENVELALLRLDDKKERRRRAKELIARVGLTEQMHRRGSKLSGGEKQRTVIARALAKFEDANGVLAEGTSLLASRITSGSSVFAMAADKMAGIADNFEVFGISLVQSDGTTATPDGEITLYLQADMTYDRNEVVVYHMADDGTLTEIVADGYGRYVRFDTSETGTFIVCIPGVAFVMPMWGYVVILVACVLVVAAAITVTIVLVRRKKKAKNTK